MPYFCSVKWVGLFVIALVGLTTIKDLWDMLGDLKMPVVRRHSTARVTACCLCDSRVIHRPYFL